MERPNNSFPSLGQQAPAVDFIENDLNKYHRAFSTPPSRYDPYLGGFVVVNPPTQPLPQPASNDIATTYGIPASETTMGVSSAVPGDILSIPPRPGPRPVEALELWDSLFPQAINQLIALHPQEPEHLVTSGQRIRNKSNWIEVFDHIEKAKNKYSTTEVDSKFRAGFRKVHRKFGDHVAEPLNRATKLVPGGGDVGVVAVTPIIGCVQILLEAARAASSVRKSVSNAFDQVEKMFSDAELFLQLYPKDKNIEKASIDLIASTLYAAENVIGFFVKGTLRKFLSATAQRENYEQKTIESLADVKTKCSTLLQEAEKTHMYHMAHDSNASMQRDTAMYAGIQRISQRQMQPHDLRNIMHELLNESENRLILHLREESYRQRKENDSLRVAFCIAAAEAARSQPARNVYYAQPQIGRRSPDSITPEDLLNWIAVPNLLGRDLQTIAERRKTRVSEREQARAEQLIRTDQMREWLTGPTSSQLLVHGNYDPRAYISGLTLFCSSLTSTLAERASRFIPLTFFCGLHTDALGGGVDAAHTGGRAIIQSFIGQLLQQFDFGSSEMPAIQLDDNSIRLGDVGELCKLFEALVRALPNYVVLFCLVDGILYYERPEFKDNMAVVLSAILKLSADDSVLVPVKVLITSPTKTVEVRGPFPPDKILSMDATAPAGLIASTSRLGRELESGLE